MENFKSGFFRTSFRTLGLFFAFVSFSLAAFAQQQTPITRADFDVTDYKMDVQIEPNGNKLTATVDVSLTPLADTRTLTFELNGSLKVDSITRENSALTAPAVSSPTTPKTRVAANTPKTPENSITFVQDQVGISDLGPNVRVDLGENVAAKTPIVLRFKYSGVLTTAQGGPLVTKRLAYVGNNQGYLMYAGRWFPFHDYAADRATSDISITIPAGLQIVGFSDQPISQTGGKYRFVRTQPGLVGNFAYGKYQTRTLRFGEYELQFYTRVANESLVTAYGETLGRALQFYTQKYGNPGTRKQIVIAQIDDDSLDYYSAQGMIFLADRLFEQSREVTEERLQREAAYQWWGLTVGLKSFDDAWLSQGLAEYSAYALRETQAKGAELENLHRETLEKALTFEPAASLLRAPSTLDDQSIAYQYLVYSKGAMVFKLLRDTLGDQKFDQLMRKFLEQYRNKNASIDDFEKLASTVNGEDLRYFFARWVEGTGVPEFSVDYQIIRTRAGKFRTRGTVKENYDNLRLPLDLQLRAEGEGEIKNTTVQIDDSSADFDIESNGKPLEVVIDPNYKLLRISDDLRITSIARRGIEQFKEGNYPEAQKQFEEALKLDRSNAWIYYNLGLLFLEQRNYDLAIDNFKVTETLGAQGTARPAWLQVWAAIKMGNAYDAKGDRSRATAAYNRAAALGDDYDNAQAAIKKYLATPYDPRGKQTTAAK